MISFDEFEQLSRSFNVIPLTRTILADMHTPVSSYLAMRDGNGFSFLLESVEPDEKVGRYSFVGVNPSRLFRGRGSKVDISIDGRAHPSPRNIFGTLRELMAQYRQAPLLPDTTGERKLGPENESFTGGLVGYLGYSTVGLLESIPVGEPSPGEEDDARFGLFPSIIRFDHRLQLINIVHNVFVEGERPLRDQYEEGRKTIEALELKLRRGAVAAQSFGCDLGRIEDGMSKTAYCDAVERARRYIFEGDIFQVVLSRQMRLGFSGDPFVVYRALRIVNPSPYLFYMDFGDTRLIGSSPEVLVRSRRGEVEVLPIAGTRRRGGTEEEDRRLETELLHDEKELAEHVMLVDLGRNDVGRISAFGSVRVPVLKRVERYSHVMHLVSEVRGTLKPGTDALTALEACFPAGTVSGAPKVRAMQIINELEARRRGVYAGAVGYIGFNGSLDTCIAIRTIVAHRETMTLQVGAGIVAGSMPELEYQETTNKAQALLDALSIASGGLSAYGGNGGRRGGSR